MGKGERAYVPALRFDRLTSLYDPLLRLTMREESFKRRLVQQARIEGGQRVLDLGCGTGTLTLLVKRLHPGAEVLGVDADPRALESARRKAEKLGLTVGLQRGMASRLPYPEDFFGRVVSSLLFHHLPRETRRATLSEALRVLRPGGNLHVADWGRPHNALLRVGFLAVQVLDGFETTRDSVTGLLPELAAAAGFEEVEETARYLTVFGTLRLYSARRPLEARPGR